MVLVHKFDDLSISHSFLVALLLKNKTKMLVLHLCSSSKRA